MSNLLSNKFKYLVNSGVVQPLSDTFKAILMEADYQFSEDNDSTYADVIASELPTGGGYTAGGQTLSGVAVSEDDAANLSAISWNSVSWGVSATSLTASGALLIDTSVSSPVVSPVVGWIDFGGNKTVNQYGAFVLSNLRINLR